MPKMFRQRPLTRIFSESWRNFQFDNGVNFSRFRPQKSPLQKKINAFNEDLSSILSVSALKRGPESRINVWFLFSVWGIVCRYWTVRRKIDANAQKECDLLFIQSCPQTCGQHLSNYLFQCYWIGSQKLDFDEKSYPVLRQNMLSKYSFNAILNKLN